MEQVWNLPGAARPGYVQRLGRAVLFLCLLGGGVVVTTGFPFQVKEAQMLWTILAILVILWVLGFSFHVAGSFIHVLLVIAVVILAFNLISGRRTV